MKKSSQIKEKYKKEKKDNDQVYNIETYYYNKIKEEEMEDRYDELKEKYLFLVKFIKNNTCNDCGIPLGVQLGDRKVCSHCHKPYCLKYVSSFNNSNEMKIICHKCQKFYQVFY